MRTRTRWTTSAAVPLLLLALAHCAAARAALQRERAAFERELAEFDRARERGQRRPATDAERRAADTHSENPESLAVELR